MIILISVLDLLFLFMEINMSVPISLIDEEVLGFLRWKIAFREESEAEGYYIKYRPEDLELLYKMYKDFQTRPDVVEKRRELYG